MLVEMTDCWSCVSTDITCVDCCISWVTGAWHYDGWFGTTEGSSL